MNPEKQQLTVLNRLSAEYPSVVSLEEIRADTNLYEVEFRRVIAYLQEKAFIELENLSQGVDGIFGSARITAAGLDYLLQSSKRVRASFIR